MNMNLEKITRYAVTVVDYGVNEGGASILEVFRDKEKAHAFMEADAIRYAEKLGEPYSHTVWADGARVGENGETSEHGAEYRIQKLEIPICVGDYADGDGDGNNEPQGMRGQQDTESYAPFHLLTVKCQVDWDIDAEDLEALGDDTPSHFWEKTIDSDSLLTVGAVYEDENDPLVWHINEDALESYVADLATDDTGWCHKSCRVLAYTPRN